MTKKIVCLLLTALILSSTFVSCGSGETAETEISTTTDTAAAETEPETDYLDVLAIQDMGGSTFAIIGQDTAGRQNFYQEEKDGDSMNDAVRTRDILVEERLNVILEYHPLEDRTAVTQAVINVISAGDEAYHLIMNSLSDGIKQLTTGEYLYDLCAIPYLRLEESYWNKSMCDNMRIFGKQYFTTGSMSLIYYMTPIVMMYNKQLTQDYQLGDINALVLDGGWTVDKMVQMVSDVSHDLNGDGIMDDTDFWGLVMDGTFGNALYTAAGMNTVKFTDDTCTLTLDSEISVDFINTCASLLGNRDIIANDPGGSGTYVPTFRESRALFMDYTVSGVTVMRDMEDDFGIIPNPKYTEEQETYLTACNTWLPSGIAVPCICSDPERTGLVMETMAYISDLYMRPAAYDVTLQGKVSRDEESAVMLDLIYSNTAFDFNTVFNFGGTSILLRNCVLGQEENFTSQYAALKSKAQSELDAMLEFAKQ